MSVRILKNVHPSARRFALMRGLMLGVASFTLPVCGAFAQQAPAPTSQPAQTAASSDKIEEITVTADRQGAKDVQKLPIAVTVINPTTLEDLGLSGLSDYTRMVPGLSMEEQAPGINSITIRGLSVRGIVPSEVEDRSLVAVYIDDMPISLKSANPDLKVLDLEDVEVLEGPQGTLYGAGAMAGTIRLVTKKPDSENYSGEVEAIGSETTKNGTLNDSFRAVLNVPLVKDELALRVSGYRGDDNGFINDIGTHKDSVNDAITDQARIALRWTPNAQLTVDASYIYDHLNAGLSDGYSKLPAYTTLTSQDEKDEDNLRLYNLTLGYDAGAVRVSESTSFMHRDTFYLADDDYDIACYPLADCGKPLTKLNNADYTIRNHIDDWTEEVRVVSQNPGPFKWTAGVFYEQGQRNFWENIPVNNFDDDYAPLIGIPGYNSEINDKAFTANDIFSGTQQTTDTQTAFFAEGTYTFFDKLDATAGLRYFDESQKYNLYFGGFYGSVPFFANPAQPYANASITSSSEAAKGVNPKFALAYHVDDDVLLYTEAAKGFRYGGNNQPVPQALCAADLAAQGLTQGPANFGPDKLWSYSIGEKSTLLDGKMTLNASAFLIDWSNVQVTDPLACSYYFTENIGQVQSKGGELSIKGKILPGLTGALNASYTDSETEHAIQSLGALPGTEVPYSPKYIASALLTYNIPVGDNNLGFTGEYSYRGTSTTSFDPQASTYRQIPSSNDFNLSINYQMENMEIGLFGDNITNGVKIIDIIAKHGYNNAPGDTVFYARPATYGLRVKYLF